MALKENVTTKLVERGYTKREISSMLDRPHADILWARRETKTLVKDLVWEAAHVIDLMRDGGRVGTPAYEGLAYFWGYKYRFWMRGDGYTGKSIERARREVHAKLLDENLELAGETPRHDEIVDEVFGVDEYKAERVAA
tara:strand:+ start:62 stop:478 length:417 start_codon:yes stop_codon:yes gene_type:complete